jgi:hypothetical protein
MGPAIHVRARLTHEFPFKLECLKGLLLNVNLWHMIMWKKHLGAEDTPTAAAAAYWEPCF